MDHAAFVEHVRTDGSRLAATAEGDLTAPVPSCPGWSVHDLVKHVAQVYEHKIECTRLGRAPDPWPPEWPLAECDPLGWFRDAHARLLAMFHESGPTTPSATWWPADQTVGFWARRMAHETAVHRVDAELAIDAATPIDAALATDGVDEILHLMLAGDWSDDPDETMAGQHVAISTGERHWIVTLDRDAVSVSEGDGPSDATLSGEPTHAMLWLWGRAPDDAVEIDGDSALFRGFRSRLALATQ
jgi:uncharacterized protein (TIGR03083 family)